MDKDEVFKRIEAWVIQIAYDNYGPEIWKWNWSQWLAFYRRIKK